MAGVGSPRQSWYGATLKGRRHAVTLMMECVEKNRPCALKETLSGHPATPPQLTACLQLALLKRSDRLEAVVALLLHAGADANATDGHGSPLLVGAAECGSERVLVLLLEHGARSLTPALHRAVIRGHPATVRLLLRAGASPAHPDPQGRTPAMLALRHDHPDVLDLLLTETQDIGLTAQDADGVSLLHLAVEQQSLNLVRFILEKAPELADCPDNHGTTPVMLAAERGHCVMLESLLEHSDAVDHRNVLQETALLLAARNDHLDCVAALVEAGSDMDLPDRSGSVPLALLVQYTPLVARLLELGACPNGPCVHCAVNQASTDHKAQGKALYAADSDDHNAPKELYGGHSDDHNAHNERYGVDSDDESASSELYEARRGPNAQSYARHGDRCEDHNVQNNARYDDLSDNHSIQDNALYGAHCDDPNVLSIAERTDDHDAQPDIKETFSGPNSDVHNSLPITNPLLPTPQFRMDTHISLSETSPLLPSPSAILEADSPLMAATRGQHLPTVRWLLIGGADPDKKSGPGSKYPLQLALYESSLELVQLLFQGSVCHLSNLDWLHDHVQDARESMDRQRDIWIWLDMAMKRIQKPPSLQAICRKSIRTKIGFECVAYKIEQLPLPKPLVHYVQLKELMDNGES